LEVDHVGNTSSVFNTSGQPFGALFSSSGYSGMNAEGASVEEEILYVADFAHGAVLAMSREHGHQETVVSSYEDKPMKGPNSLCMVDGDIFFTDSGAMGETGLHSPTGSVYMIGQGPHGRILRPISLNNLAYPAGIAVTRDKKFM
jgi:sugar lactone lactonase YvrE